MSKCFLIYDPEGDFATMGPKHAKGIGAAPQAIRGPQDLKSFFFAQTDIDQLMFYTHGDPGRLSFKASSLAATDLREMFGAGGVDRLFAANARVYFIGCKVAAIHADCGLPAACAETDNGVVFMKTFAKLLFKRGGHASGFTDNGLAIWPSTTPMHNGTEVHAIVNLNQRNYGGVRMAVGSELSKPYENNFAWKVWDGKEYFYCIFSPRNGGTVIWLTEDEYEDKSTPTDEERRAAWEFDGDSLRIEWSTELETWDLPLFSIYQTGITKGNDSIGVSIRGRLGQGGTGDVWAQTVQSRFLINAISD